MFKSLSLLSINVIFCALLVRDKFPFIILNDILYVLLLYVDFYFFVCNAVELLE